MEYIRDFKGSEDGDIIIEDGKLLLADHEQTIRQGIEKRLKTNNPDWYRHFQIGSNLEDLKGRDNTRLTGNIGVRNIESSLTHDRFINKEDLEVRAVPTGANEITYYIKVRLGYNKEITMEFPIDIA